MEFVTQAIPTGLNCSGAIAHAKEDHASNAANAEVDRHFARRGHGEEFDMEARWILRGLPDNASSILDIGCGIGALFPLIGASRVVGIDYAHSGLRRTRERFPAARLACGDGAALPFEDMSFDAITAQHVVEHLPDAATACKEWRRVLQSNGRLIIVTPNAEFLDPSLFDDPTHVQLFDRKSLRQTIENSGLIVERICTLGLPWIRQYRTLPGGWRLRRMLLRRAEMFARLPRMRWAGQSLCCIARRSDR
jgi:SAM-dependent methyltransferase